MLPCARSWPITRRNIVLSVSLRRNLCDDVTYSGTVAAAMEATLLGVPAVAFSLVTDGASVIHWETAEKWAPEVLGRLCSAGWPAAVVININFPNLPARAIAGIEATRQGGGKTGQGMTATTDPHGDAIYWLGTEGHGERIRAGEDVEAVKRGAIRSRRCRLTYR
jgi:5'-nucleotidase